MYYTIHPDATKPGQYFYCVYGMRGELVFESATHESKEAAKRAAIEYTISWKKNNA